MSLRKSPEPKFLLPGRRVSLYILLAVVVSINTACQLSRPSPCLPSNRLIALDPGDAQTASADMLALYHASSGTRTSLRIDLLDFSIGNEPSFTILLDTFPGSRVRAPANLSGEDRWELSLQIEPDRLVSASGDLVEFLKDQVSVAYDPQLDIVEVDFPCEIVRPPGPFQVLIASHAADTNQAADILGPIRSDSRSPEPIPILLSFSNVLPAITPAQALRSWDGAHHGPAGERFGLRHLLTAVERNKVPVVLSDLKRSDSLQGLEILGATPWIQELEGRGLLSLPDALPFSLCEQAAAMGWPETIVERIGAEATALGYSPASELACFYAAGSHPYPQVPSRYRALILSPAAVIGDDAIRSAREHHDIYQLNDVDTTSTLSSDRGLSINLRRQLTERLDPTSSAGVLVLSMDFQRSFWGNPQIASDSLGWISAHSWIQPVSLEQYALSDLPLLTPKREHVTEAKTLTDAGSVAPPVSLEQVLPYFDPANSSGLQAFAWYLLYQSHSIPACHGTINSVGSEEDMLSSCLTAQQVIRNGFQHLSTVQQWEQFRQRPRSAGQIATGGDVDEGAAAAIEAVDAPWLIRTNRYDQTLESVFAFDPIKGSTPIIWNLAPFPNRPGEEISFETSYRYEDDQLEIEIFGTSPEARLSLPIFLAPNWLTRKEACITANEKDDVVSFGCSGDTAVQINIQDASWSFDSVLDSPGRWSTVEDPNQEMPPGHFLPIPYGLLQVEYEHPFTLVLRKIE